MDHFKKILLLAPHPDDGEFGCGGSLSRWCEEKKELWYVAFSPCKASVPEDFDHDVLYKELAKSTTILGIPQERVITFDYPVREFLANRQAILEQLLILKRKIDPDLVLLPNSTDVHQDHQTIYNEGVRAFKNHNILGYELPWNNLSVTTNFHVRLKEHHLETKWKAISAYASQAQRSYKSKDLFTGLARVRGAQVATEYAEAFEMIRWVH